MKKRNYGGLFVFLLVLGTLVLGICGYFTWTDNNLEWMFSQLAKRPVQVNNFVSFILTCIMNIFGLLFNIVIEILKAIL